jgi:polyphosphate kinase 2 (PPK2 family)
MFDLSDFLYDGSRHLKLKELDTSRTTGFETKEQAAQRFAENTRRMIEEQGKLYASGQYSLLLILQAMDAAGKDGAIARVMGGLNPQGTQVHSFKQQTSEELSHDYLWRANRHLPERACASIIE